MGGLSRIVQSVSGDCEDDCGFFDCGELFRGSILGIIVVDKKKRYFGMVLNELHKIYLIRNIS